MKNYLRYSEYVSTAVSVVGLLLVPIIIGLQFSERNHLQEIIFGIGAVAIGALSGIFSSYISRIANRLSSQKRIFISYSREEKGFAEQLREKFVNKGLVVWLDKNDLLPGDDLEASINAAIENSNAFVTVVSQNPGPLVMMEIRAAVQKHIPIFAVLDQGEALPQEMEKLRNITYSRNKDPEIITESVIATL